MALLQIEPPPPSKAANFDGWMSKLWAALRAGATQIDLGADVSGALPVANGGTAATTVAGARTSLDVPKRDGTDATGTWDINILGTSTNDSASAGHVGEYLSSTVESGSAVSLTTDTPANMTSLALTAGDWDVRLLAVFDPAVSTTVSDLHASLSTTSATMDTAVDRFTHMSTSLGAGSHHVSLEIAAIRVSLASTTTVYAVAEATFAASTCAVYGLISARRVR